MKHIENKYRLNRARSIVALIISVSIMAIFAVALIRQLVIGNEGYRVFKFFTTVSNILAAYASVLTIPYALDGIFKQRYRVSKQITRLLFCGTLCVTMTMILALCLLWPVGGSRAVEGYNFWGHIVCPILIIILFVLVSREKTVSVSDCIISTIPFLIYIIIYAIMVVFIGEENGGWEDLYCVLDHLKPVPAFLIAIVVVFAISFAFRFIHNIRAKRCWNKMIQEIIQRYQPEDGAGVRFMLFEMGELMGAYDGQYEIIVPIQLLQILSEYYKEISLDDMVSVFVTGAMSRVKSDLPEIQPPK